MAELLSLEVELHLIVSAALAYFASGSVIVRACKGLAVGGGVVLLPVVVILVIPMLMYV